MEHIVLTKERKEYLDERFVCGGSLYDSIQWFDDNAPGGDTAMCISIAGKVGVAFNEDHLRDLTSLTVYPTDIEVAFERRKK